MLFVPHVNEYVATMREINKRAFKTDLLYLVSVKGADQTHPLTHTKSLISNGVANFSLTSHDNDLNLSCDM